jgi:hypothetical protein
VACYWRPVDPCYRGSSIRANIYTPKLAPGSCVGVACGRWSATLSGIAEANRRKGHNFSSAALRPILVVSDEAAPPTLVQVLKQCGNDLTHANIMKQAAILKNDDSGLLLAGIRIKISPTNFAPIRQLRLIRNPGSVRPGHEWRGERNVGQKSRAGPLSQQELPSQGRHPKDSCPATFDPPRQRVDGALSAWPCRNGYRVTGKDGEGHHRP